MMRQLLPMILLLLTSISHASNCSSVANEINRDISKYSITLGQKKLAWMNLNWLKQVLGPAQVQKVSPDELQYKWVCPEESDAYIAVVANRQGRINNIDGVYSTDDGAGTLSLCVSCLSVTKPAPPPQHKYLSPLKSVKEPRLQLQRLKKHEFPKQATKPIETANKIVAVGNPDSEKATEKNIPVKGN